MRKIVLIILSLFFIIPAFAGPYEDALRSGEPVFLYMYMKNCKHCKTFNPIYEKTFNNYKSNFRFVKVDADSPYGTLLMRDLRASYVPLVILADSKRQYMMSITPDCLIDNACLEKELKGFLK